MMIVQLPYEYYIPTTGFSHTIASWANRIVINPAGTLASGTITMPAYPKPGQRVQIFSTQIVTSLTHSANTSQTLVGGLSALTANAVGGTWEWCLETQTWYPA